MMILLSQGLHAVVAPPATPHVNCTFGDATNAFTFTIANAPPFDVRRRRQAQAE